MATDVCQMLCCSVFSDEIASAQLTDLCYISALVHLHRAAAKWEIVRVCVDAESLQSGAASNLLVGLIRKGGLYNLQTATVQSIVPAGTEAPVSTLVSPISTHMQARMGGLGNLACWPGLPGSMRLINQQAECTPRELHDIQQTGRLLQSYCGTLSCCMNPTWHHSIITRSASNPKPVVQHT